MDNPKKEHNQKPTIEAEPQVSPAPKNVMEVDPDVAVVPGVENDRPVTVVVKPPKKSKLGLILGIIFIVLFLAGGGALAYWYFGVYSSPENVARDAVNQLITAKNVVTTGNISAVISEDEDSRIVAKVELENSSNHLPSSTTAKLSLTEYDNGNRIIENHDVTIELGTAIMSDGVIYLQVSNLRESFDAIAGESQDSLGDSFSDVVREIIDLIDNEWWRISIPDILNEAIGKELAKSPIAFYNCIIDVANSADYSEIATLYNANPFAKIEKDESAIPDEPGVTAYNLNINNDLAASFLNGLSRTTIAEDTYACYNKISPYADLSAEDAKLVTGSDVADALPEDLSISALISDASHQLKYLGAASVDHDNGRFISAELNFDYSEVEISAPESYRDFTDLLDDLSDIIVRALYDYDINVDEFIEQTL